MTINRDWEAANGPSRSSSQAAFPSGWLITCIKITDGS